MKIKKSALLLIILVICHSAYTLNYITTAESISWNGAYASVSEGFESMLYNPAGLFMTPSKYGLNLFGTYGVRYYNNSISTDHVLKLLEMRINDQNATNLLSTIITGMPVTGFDTGFDVSLLNFMTYFKYSDFSLGFSILPKTNFTATIDKNLFVYLFQELSLQNELTFKINSTFFQYVDFNFVLSGRAKALEKYIPVDAIYIGLTGHFYLPTVFVKAKLDESSLSSFAWDNSYGLYGYRVKFKGNIQTNMNLIITEPVKAANVVNRDLAGFNLQSFVNNSGSFGFGVGFDMGFIVQFNKYVRAGFSVTDLGFITFPQSSSISADIYTDVTFDPSSGATFNFTKIGNDLLSGLQTLVNSGGETIAYQFWLPNTSIRTGVGILPIRSRYFDMIIAADLSLSDLNRMLIGDYPTFNLSIGMEINPKVSFIEIPIRLAFNYNTQVNAPSFSTGIGLYLGPVEMEIGVKGLEALIKELGAKEICIGLDFKLEF